MKKPSSVVLFLFFVVFVVLLFSPELALAKKKEKGRELPSGSVMTATWYGVPSTEGKMTASGRPFTRHDPHAIAAPKRFALGSWLEVTSQDTGDVMYVLVIDRCPKDSVIDFTRAGADQMGILKEGSVKVSVRFVGWQPV